MFIIITLRSFWWNSHHSQKLRAKLNMNPNLSNLAPLTKSVAWGNHMSLCDWPVKRGRGRYLALGFSFIFILVVKPWEWWLWSKWTYWIYNGLRFDSCFCDLRKILPLIVNTATVLLGHLIWFIYDT